MHYVAVIHIVLVPSATIRIVVVVVTAMLAHKLILARIDPVAIAIVNVGTAVVARISVAVVQTTAIGVLEAILTLLTYTKQLDPVTMYDLDILDIAIEIRRKRPTPMTIVVSHDTTVPISIVRIPLITQPRIEVVISLRVVT
jgi:hypothetical protein